ncbi:MAG: hypothetical protein IJ106_16190 [Parasporobacterium sp.]|nr:hypothetical protein [Parasporobacterium sp.]MBQ9032966.1 hypothetical protein [Parasporobacterium sp.]
MKEEEYLDKTVSVRRSYDTTVSVRRAMPSGNPMPQSQPAPTPTFGKQKKPYTVSVIILFIVLALLIAAGVFFAIRYINSKDQEENGQEVVQEETTTAPQPDGQQASPGEVPAETPGENKTFQAPAGVQISFDGAGTANPPAVDDAATANTAEAANPSVNTANTADPAAADAAAATGGTVMPAADTEAVPAADTEAVPDADPAAGNAISFYAQTNGTENVTRLRSAPGGSNAALFEIARGETLLITDLAFSSEDGMLWGNTSYIGYSGWVPVQELKVTEEEGAMSPRIPVLIRSEEDYVNFRTGAGISNEAVSYIPNGTPLSLIDIAYNPEDGLFWGRTAYDGQDGWISLRQTSIERK